MGAKATSMTAIEAIFARSEDRANAAMEEFLGEIREYEKTLPPPVPEPNDSYGPPLTPVKVRCWHCNSMYMSSDIIYEYRLEFQYHACVTLKNITPLWWCARKNCDGGGFGHDIHPIKQRKART